MNNADTSQSAPEALVRLADLFAAPFHEIEGAIVLGNRGEALRHLEEFRGDPTGFEAFVNHVHLEDIVSGISFEPRTKRRRLLYVGEILINVWVDRFVALLRDRAALFYLGGSNDVTLRFHLEREQYPPWLPCDSARSARMLIFRATAGKVVKIS